jgi:hypothetical protein
MNIYSPCLCFHPLNHNYHTKEASMCYSVPVFLCARFNPRQFFNALRRHKRSASQTLACTQTCIFRVENVCNAFGHYEQILSNAIHHTSNVNLLQEKVKSCCDLLKQRTFHLLLFCLSYANSDHIRHSPNP